MRSPFLTLAETDVSKRNDGLHVVWKKKEETGAGSRRRTVTSTSSACFCGSLSTNARIARHTRAEGAEGAEEYVESAESVEAAAHKARSERVLNSVVSAKRLAAV